MCGTVGSDSADIRRKQYAQAAVCAGMQTKRHISKQKATETGGGGGGAAAIAE